MTFLPCCPPYLCFGFPKGVVHFPLYGCYNTPLGDIHQPFLESSLLKSMRFAPGRFSPWKPFGLGPNSHCVRSLVYNLGDVLLVCLVVATGFAPLFARRVKTP